MQAGRIKERGLNWQVNCRGPFETEDCRRVRRLPHRQGMKNSPLGDCGAALLAAVPPGGRG